MDMFTCGIYFSLTKCLGYFLRHASVIVPRKLSINETLCDIEWGVSNEMFHYSYGCNERSLRLPTKQAFAKCSIYVIAASLGVCLILLYTLPLGRCVPSGLCLHIYQANPSRLCYKLYIFTILDI